MQESIGSDFGKRRIAPKKFVWAYQPIFYKLFYFFLRYDLPSRVINLPFILRRSRMAVAVTASKSLPQSEGTRFVVTRVVATSVRLEMI